MSHLMAKAGPGSWRGHGPAELVRAIGVTPTAIQFIGKPTQGQEPLALQVFKPDRRGLVTIGKVTFLQGWRIFAIAHDKQKGVESHISIPEVALDFADRWGCRWLYFWRSATLEARRTPFDGIRSIGYWGPGAGRERYIPIAALELIGYWARPKWQWASEVLQLATPQGSEDREPEGKQLSFDTLMAGVL